MFDNCTDQLAHKLENTQRQAILAITRGYQNTSSVKLLEEVGMETLGKRRKNQKLIQLFKMKNNLVPMYLASLTPQEIGQNLSYNLRNANALRVPKTTKNYYLKSFIPSTTQLWNILDHHIRLLTDLDLFKKLIQQNSPKKLNKSYLCGTSEGHVHLSRIRMGLSGLNAHRKRYHFIDHNICPCCNTNNENEIHFFLICTNHAAHRGDMLVQLSHTLPQHTDILNDIANKRSQKKICDIITCGTGKHDVDLRIFKIVSSFIEKTNRFNVGP